MWNARLVAPIMIAPAITKPPIEADNWKIESNFFTLIKDTYFHGLIYENPFEHIQHFNDLCDIYKTKNVTDDTFKLRAFPFTLQGDAKAWMRSLPSDSITSFQELTNEFINHFFPPSKVERLRMEINGFTQRGDERLYDAWVRFKKLLRACPPHGLMKKEYINNFTKEYIDSLSGGVFMYKSPNAAEIMLEDISINTTNQNPNNPNQNENINVITTRSGLTTQWVKDPQPQPFITHEPLPSFIEEDIGVSNEKGKEKVNSTEGTGNDELGKKKGDESSKIMRPVPYPKALKKDKLAAQHKKFQKMMKNVSVNLPITDMLKGMSNYGRFIKELISQRGKYHDKTSFFIEEECNKILPSRPRIPKKLGDPRKFVFPCKFGESEEFNALADLGASINLMPHSL
ncbi:uncharacterized protein [Rutidosis leptorrhynchoides]|uniref:uncharacterized protein n=1 Tax=Rutidosis leptorrhynchoides TaxID=125765 RepID=UPI003A990581